MLQWAMQTMLAWAWAVQDGLMTIEKTGLPLLGTMDSTVTSAAAAAAATSTVTTIIAATTTTAATTTATTATTAGTIVT